MSATEPVPSPTSSSAARSTSRIDRHLDGLPLLLTVREVAALLRTSPKAVYASIERGLVPGVVRTGRRILVRRDDLLRSLGIRRASSPKEVRR